MQFNQINLHRDSQGIASEDLPNFILQHENALSYKIDGTVTNKGSLYNFEQRLKKIKNLVVQHVQDCMVELSCVTSRQKTLFTSDQVSSGAVSHDAVLLSLIHI